MGGRRLPIRRAWDGRPAPRAEWVEVEVALDDPVRIRVEAPWHGDPPPAGPPGPTDRLWEHEVVELFFVGPPGERVRYTEVELGPHGHHLVLRLEGVRRPVARGLPLDYAVAREGDRWVGRAAIPRAWLPDRLDRWNAFAIHGLGEARRYLAWSPVPGPAVDFHRLAIFPRLDTRGR